MLEGTRSKLAGIALFSLVLLSTAAVAVPVTHVHSSDPTCQGNSPCYDNITDALQNVDNGGTVWIRSNITGSIRSTEGRQNVTVRGVNDSIQVTSQLLLEQTVTGWTIRDLFFTSSCIVRDVAASLTILNVSASVIKVGDLTQDTTATIVVRDSTARGAGNIAVLGEPGASLGGSIVIEDSVADTVQIQLQVASGPVTTLSSDITIDNNQLADAGAISVVGLTTSGVGAITGDIVYTNNVSSSPPAKFGILTFGNMTGDISSPLEIHDNQLAWIAVITIGANSGGITGNHNVTNNTVEALEWVTNGGPFPGTLVFRDNQVLDMGDVTMLGNPLLLVDGVGVGSVLYENNFAPDADVVIRASGNGGINGFARAIGNTAGLLTIDSQGNDYGQPIEVVGNVLPPSGDPALSRITIRSLSGADSAGGVIRDNEADELLVNFSGFLTGDLDTTFNTVRQLTTLNANGTFGGAVHTVSGNDFGGSVSFNGLHSTANFNRINFGMAVIPGTTVDATLNWWKCNGGPGAPGCSVQQNMPFPVAPWLTFNGEATCEGDTAVASFDVWQASNGASPPGNITPGVVTITTPNGTVLDSPKNLAEGEGCTFIDVQAGVNNPSVTMTLDSQSVVSVANCTGGPPLAVCPLFADGFESGDTSAWSQLVP